MAHLPGALATRAGAILRACLVEKWKSDATSPSPRNDFASYDHRAIRPPASPPVGGWLAIYALCAALAGCHVLPEIQFARTLPAVALAHARRYRKRRMAWSAAPSSARVTRELAATGDTSLLDYHLAAMRDIGAPPLLTGNQVELLVDGPRTYEAMFAAIEKARDYVLVESFIFEEAVAGDRTLSALLARSDGAAACTSTCSMTPWAH